MTFYEIWVDGERQNPPEFSSEDAERRALDILSDNMFAQVEVRPIRSTADVR